MQRHLLLSLLIALPLVAFCSDTAWAEGSLGSGGPAGERSDWPCEGCSLLAPPGYDPAVPTPLLVTLHGDEGHPGYIRQRLERETMARGMLMLNLKCPRDLGCGAYDGSWWRWEAYSNQHDVEWLGRKVDAVEADYNVELQRVFLAGFSGGSSYLSEYPWHRTMRYAGLIYFAGGYSPEGRGFACEDSACKLPSYFLIGSRDFLLDGARRLRSYLDDCGHDVVWDEIRGVDHQIILDRLPAVFDWIADNPHMCRQPPEPVEPELGDALGCSGLPDCGACPDCVSECACQTGSGEGCFDMCHGEPDEGPGSPDIGGPRDPTPDDDGWTDGGDHTPPAPSERLAPQDTITCQTAPLGRRPGMGWVGVLWGVLWVFRRGSSGCRPRDLRS